MLKNQGSKRSFYLALWVGLVGLGAGLVTGFLAGANPFLLGLALVSVTTLCWFFASFEQAVIGLLILRSSLDLFSAQQVPAAFAIGLNGLILLYVVVAFLTSKPIQTNGFLWFFAAWVMLQVLWLILLPIGGLGMDASFLPGSIRVWLRYFSWLMVYLLVLQLKDRMHPEKIISLLLLSLVAPITVALMQILLPSSVLPPLLTSQGKAGSNVPGTLGFPNGLGLFLIMFLPLTWWKLQLSAKRWPWILLLAIIAFVFGNTGYLTGLMSVLVIILFLNVAKLTPIRLIGGVILCSVIVCLFASTEFGQQRLAGIYQTPLLNPDIDVSRAVILSYGDSNSFNWRIAHWNLLLNAWTQYPIFGYGIDTSPELGIRNLQTGVGYQAHNDYIQFLVEQGIVGLVIFLTFLIGQAWYLVQLIKNSPPKSPRRDLCLILAALFVSNILSMLTSNIMTGTTYFFYWWTLLAIAGWGNEQWATNKSSSKDFSN